MTDIFKSFASAMDRQIERKRFNPDLTHGEYNALSEDEKTAWLERLLDYWTDHDAKKLDWDYEPSGYQDVNNGEFSA
jgi:hypothetical protein